MRILIISAGAYFALTCTSELLALMCGLMGMCMPCVTQLVKQIDNMNALDCGCLELLCKRTWGAEVLHVTFRQGDQYVVLNVRLPRDINEQQRRLLESFREEEQQRKKKAA